jgi:hypothetical protein
MNKGVLISFCSIFLLLSVACTRHVPKTQLMIEVPAGFTGDFTLNMGVRGATPLQKDGVVYVVTVPQSGKLETSTFLEKPTVTFKNGSDGRIWGFSQLTFTTGDGISTGGKIEFFVGTQKEFEAEQKKKNKSGRFSNAAPELAGA